MIKRSNCCRFKVNVVIILADVLAQKNETPQDNNLSASEFVLDRKTFWVNLFCGAVLLCGRTLKNKQFYLCLELLEFWKKAFTLQCLQLKAEKEPWK